MCSFVCSISGVETDRAWRREGQKLSTATPRFVAHRTMPCGPQVLAAATGACSNAGAQEAGIRVTGEEAGRTKAMMPSSIQNALRMIISQCPLNQLGRPASPTPNQPVAAPGDLEPAGVDGTGPGPGKMNGVGGGKGKAYSQLEILLCEESLANKRLTKLAAKAAEKKQEKGDAKPVEKPGSKLTEKQKVQVYVPSAAPSVDRKGESGGRSGVDSAPTDRTKDTRKRGLSSGDCQAAVKKAALDLPFHLASQQPSPPNQHNVRPLPEATASQPRQVSPLVSTPPSQRASSLLANPPTTSPSVPNASTAFTTTPTLPATPTLPPVPPTTPMEVTPPSDTLISDLISDTSDTAVFSLASELGLANVTSLLNLSDFMTFIQPNIEEATPIDETTPSIAQLSGVGSAVSAPFPVATPLSLLTPTHSIAQPLPLQTNNPHPPVVGISNPPGMTPPLNVPGPPPLMTPTHQKLLPPPLAMVPSLSPPSAGNRPDSLALQTTPASSAAVTIAAPSVAEDGGVMSSADYLDFTDIGSLMGSADDLLEGIPEDMAKSIQTLVQLDQQAWN